MANIMQTGLSALTASQRALATAGHNIANANTSGYTRQRVELTANRPEYIGGTTRSQYIGNGVSAQSISRVYDGFLTEQARNYGSNVGQLAAKDRWISQLDSVIGDGSTGLAPAVKQFFASAQDVANSPASLPARQALLGQAETLAGQFNTLDGKINVLRDGVNQDLSGAVTTINGLAENIAKANQAILTSSGGSGGASPDLLDQRDQLVANLAQKVSVNTVVQSDGSMTVFIGNGQSLVMGVKANTLETKLSTSDSRKLDIQFQQGGLVITDALSNGSGEVSGLLAFQDQVLDPAQNKLGLMAAGLAETFNAQHQLGLDFNGNAGSDFFTNSSSVPTSQKNTANTGTGSLTLTIANIGDLQPSDYELSYDGAAYNLRRLSDDKMVVTGSSGPITVDGMDIAISGAPAAGDKFRIQFTRNGAASFKALIKDPREFAAADSAGGVGNNANALKLAGMQTEKILLNGSSTYQDLHSQVVSEVGTQGNSTSNTLKTQEALQDQAVQARDSVSGVNLDEEAANLMKYQRSYEAAAKVIQVGDAIIQSLLDAVRR